MLSSTAAKKELRIYATRERKKTNEWFFKTAPGEYGEHDRFLGVANPDVRKVAKKFREMTLPHVQKLLMSQYNEDRLCALVILVTQFTHQTFSQKNRDDIYRFYLENIIYVNNWNLVDLSAPHIVGEYLVTHSDNQDVLDVLVQSRVQWQRRVCILATWAFIKRGNNNVTLFYAQKLLQDHEDLMHKAVGWMLREVWKKDAHICENFLCIHYDALARTTLRYAIEKMEEKKRKSFLSGDCCDILI